MITVGKVFKEGVTFAMPWSMDRPVGGCADTVILGLDKTYIDLGRVFQGSVIDYIQFALQVGIPEWEIREGFAELQRDGYLTLEGDIFTPLEPLIKRYR